MDWRQQRGLSVDVGSIVIVVGNLLSAAGGVVRKVGNRVGRKPLGLITGLLAALVTLVFAFMPIF